MKLATGWFGTDLGEYRTCESTYDLYPAESLPDLPPERFDGTFAWLPSADLPSADLPSADLPSADPPGEGMEPTRLPDRLAADLPASFEYLMRRPEIQAAVPSCTACYWDLSDRVVEVPEPDGGRLVRFLNDQQGCLYWYLHLLPGGGHQVVCGGGRYDNPAQPFTAARMSEDLVIVAADFEQFVYRFWVENVAWFEVVDKESTWNDLSAPVREYLRHYR